MASPRTRGAGPKFEFRISSFEFRLWIAQVSQPGQLCLLADLGLIRYAESLALQQRLVAARKAGALPHVLLFCEHPHVITQGRNGRPEHLLSSDRALRQMHVEYFDTKRGGDVTYHGPGQLVAYPVFDLTGLRRDVVWFVRSLENAMIAASVEMGVAADRLLPNWQGKTGVWVHAEQAEALPTKLGAIGVHVSRWVTSHGLAWNVRTDLRYFELIVPCGIVGCRAASLEQVLGRPVEMPAALRALSRAVGNVFDLRLEKIDSVELTARLDAWENQAANVAVCG
jgi:lipoyl(octanoyl) transferase